MKHLWDVKHRYYCNLGNYFSNDCGYKYKSWAAFIKAEGDSDFDMNLLFRWDWIEQDGESGEPNFNGDVYYRNGEFRIFWIGQRKGLYRYTTIEVCRADEEEVIKFLRPRFKHLKSLWEPLK